MCWVKILHAKRLIDQTKVDSSTSFNDWKARQVAETVFAFTKSRDGMIVVQERSLRDLCYSAELVSIVLFEVAASDARNEAIGIVGQLLMEVQKLACKVALNKERGTFEYLCQKNMLPNVIMDEFPGDEADLLFLKDRVMTLRMSFFHPNIDHLSLSELNHFAGMAFGDDSVSILHCSGLAKVFKSYTT
eukprot:TRINITY_DN162250_c0_g2_i1.p1 TRINITY_DN162250_c0_g2~~TRINITY_DN162250_c0_g2_i1.p1  ORF type:complete len:189 (-),score=26.10 TRINITY_DN162250_c0_g2_i1:357-923(-)